MNEIDGLRMQQQLLLNRLNSLSVEQPKFAPNDAYSEIEQANSTLTNNDRSDLLKDCQYQALVSKLNTFIQQEQFRLIRGNLIQNQDAVNVMKLIAEYIRQFKTENDLKKQSAINDFVEYTTKYSDMSYNEYLKIKNA